MFSVPTVGCHVGYSREFVGTVYCTYGQSNTTIVNDERHRIYFPWGRGFVELYVDRQHLDQRSIFVFWTYSMHSIPHPLHAGVYQSGDGVGVGERGLSPLNARNISRGYGIEWFWFVWVPMGSHYALLFFCLVVGKKYSWILTWNCFCKKKSQQRISHILQGWF